MNRFFGWGMAVAILIFAGVATAAGDRPAPEKGEEAELKSDFTESKCPQCRSKKNVIPIVYGMPDESLMEEAKQGRVALGGCIMDPKNPHWLCKSCKKEW